MKALLLIFMFSEGTGASTGAAVHSNAVLFPSMAACQVAAEQASKVRGPPNGAVGAFCVEYR